MEVTGEGETCKEFSRRETQLKNSSKRKEESGTRSSGGQV